MDRDRTTARHGLTIAMPNYASDFFSSLLLLLLLLVLPSVFMLWWCSDRRECAAVLVWCWAGRTWSRTLTLPFSFTETSHSHHYTHTHHPTLQALPTTYPSHYPAPPYCRPHTAWRCLLPPPSLPPKQTDRQTGTC